MIFMQFREPHVKSEEKKTVAILFLTDMSFRFVDNQGFTFLEPSRTMLIEKS
jgi:hypothetical protein